MLTFSKKKKNDTRDRAISLASATITRRLTSIINAHQAAGFADSPSSSRHFIVGETLKVFAVPPEPSKSESPLPFTADIRKTIGRFPDNLMRICDRALVLTGFAGAFEDRNSPRSISWMFRLRKAGTIIDLRKSKTDQESSGCKVAIPFGTDRNTSPLRALLRSLKQARIIMRQTVHQSAACSRNTRARGRCYP
jgi:hypothetical protein